MLPLRGNWFKNRAMTTKKIRFIDLKPEELKGLDSPIFKNGRSLYKDAHLLVKVNDSYSSATSLAILSTEEYVKAILILLESEGNKIFLLKNAKSFFTGHKIRHNIAQMIEMGQGLFDTVTKWEDKKRNRRLTKGNKTFINVVNWLDRLAGAAITMNSSKERIEFLLTLDSLKNNGLYVDFNNELLEPNVTVDKGSFKKVLDINQRVLRFYKLLRILYNPSLSNHMAQNEINKLKNELKDFIKVGLEGFSFSELNKIESV